MSKILYFNSSSDFSLSSPAVQHNTVVVCLQCLVWFPLPAETGVFVANRARFERGQNGEIKSTRRIRGSQMEVVVVGGAWVDVNALCGNTAETPSTHFLEPSKTSSGN